MPACNFCPSVTPRYCLQREMATSGLILCCRKPPLARSLLPFAFADSPLVEEKKTQKLVPYLFVCFFFTSTTFFFACLFVWPHYFVAHSFRTFVSRASGGSFFFSSLGFVADLMDTRKRLNAALESFPNLISQAGRRPSGDDDSALPAGFVLARFTALIILIYFHFAKKKEKKNYVAWVWFPSFPFFGRVFLVFYWLLFFFSFFFFFGTKRNGDRGPTS